MEKERADEAARREWEKKQETERKEWERSRTGQRSGSTRSGRGRTSVSRRRAPVDPVVKVLTSATFIRGVFGILKKVI
jgi:hypothetical protein